MIASFLAIIVVFEENPPDSRSGSPPGHRERSLPGRGGFEGQQKRVWENNTIFLFQEPLEEICASMKELEQEIEITLVHEIAHAVGISEERPAELGYD